MSAVELIPPLWLLEINDFPTIDFFCSSTNVMLLIRDSDYSELNKLVPVLFFTVD